MNTERAIEITQKVFRIIEQKNLGDIQNIEKSILKDYKNKYVDINKSPRINFIITQDEINKIDVEFTEEYTSTITDPLAKLLYTLAWKQGDLHKLKHIVQGIKEVDSEGIKEGALIFYNFGKYIAKPEFHPIVDQHVIRAFLVYKAKTDEEIEKYRKLNDSSKIKKEDIENYKEWIRSLGTSLNEQERKDLYYHIDRNLFALGKIIKKT